MSHQNPYIGFGKDFRGIKSLWERFNAGLVDTSEPRDTYQTMLLSEWQRCMTLGVDVAMTVAPKLSDEEFRHRTQANQLLIETSVPIIKDVGRFLDEVPGLMILTEHTGSVLHITGDPRVCDLAADRAGIVEGSKWDEASTGTNGLGTALITGQPVHVYASEHFCEGWHSWTCAAAPIFDTDGRRMLGIVDFTAPEGDFRDQALALTVSLANSIQSRIALHRELERSRIVNAFNEVARQYPSDDLLALDDAGRVIMHSPNDRCSRIARNWSAGGINGAAARKTIEVTAPDSGARIGTIVLLSAKSASDERVFRSIGATPPPDEPIKRFGEFVTLDPETGRMLDELQRAAAADVSVLITGETGTGKELLARHLHAISPRCSEPYLAINCGAISAELMESTFFGYVKGAFSGADPRGRAGYFESTRGGTLFLDEVGELPLATQAALLRVLEDGSYQRIGSSETLHARCRIVAATHRNLEQLVEQRLFREDLYYRLKIVHKSVKPLRERRCDIPLLVKQFVDVMRLKHGLTSVELTPEAMASLARYSWPGNAREVRNVVEAAILCSEGSLGIDCLPPEVLRRTHDHDPHKLASEVEPTPATGSEYERQLIVGMLRKYRKVNHAAKAMGIARSTLYRKFAELGIDPTEFTAGPGE
jgi:sigma-54 dependent transcriptional regulator, acetoin dehydrogenase operon transcriptional activator AcoR